MPERISKLNSASQRYAGTHEKTFTDGMVEIMDMCKLEASELNTSTNQVFPDSTPGNVLRDA